MADFIISAITDVQIRNDGELIKITFGSVTGQTVTVAIKLSQLLSVTTALISISNAMEFNEGMPSDAIAEPRAFSPPPHVLHVTDFGVVRDVDKGQMQLRVRTVQHGEVQLSFLAADAERLFQLLLETQQFDDDQTAH
jgi:hypothetical protein